MFRDHSKRHTNGTKFGKYLATKLLRVAALLFALSGCASSSGETVSEPPPAGFIRAKDAGGLPEGSAIYSRTGHKVGIVKEYDANHKFPNGEVEAGVLIEQAPDVQNWMVLSVVENGFFVKKP